MPRADLPSPQQLARRRGRGRKRRSPPFEEPRRYGGRRKRDLDDGGVTVDPHRPLDLSGGAAAALDFDEPAP